jgi:hypothetical protein
MSLGRAAVNQPIVPPPMVGTSQRLSVVGN